MKLHLKNFETSHRHHNPKDGGDYAGTDWSRSTMRPGCQDHLQHPSRRGDERVEHRLPLSMQATNPRGAGSRVLADLQRIAGGEA